MSLQDLVTVNISSSTVSPTRPGFGTPLVAAYHKHYTDIVRFYSSLAGMVGDGFATTEPAYLAAAAIFSQNPSPAKVAIGRRAAVFTQALKFTLSSSSATDNYTLTMVGADGTSHDFGFASTGVANTDAGTLVTKINTATMTAVKSSGTTPPVMTLTGTPTVGVSMVFKITTGGARGTAVFEWSQDGGATYTTSVTTAATNSLGSTGLTANWATGTYNTDNVYTAYSALGFAAASSAVVTVTHYPGLMSDVQNWNPLGTTSPILALQDATANPGLATDLTAMQQFAPPGSWYGLALDSNSAAEVTAAAAWAESNGAYIFLYNNSDTHCLTTDTDDIFSTQKALAHARSAGLYAGSQLMCYSGAAWLGKTLPQNPGSLTFMYKTLSGVPADNLSETAQTNLNNKKGNYYIPIAGINITVNGWTASGEFIDIVWGTDWLTAQIQIDVFALLASSLKVPYNDLGVDMIKSVVQADLQLAASPQFNFLDTKPAPTVSAPPVADIAVATRASRVFPQISFSGKLAGAIHQLTISGVLTP